MPYTIRQGGELMAVDEKRPVLVTLLIAKYLNKSKSEKKGLILTQPGEMCSSQQERFMTRWKAACSHSDKAVGRETGIPSPIRLLSALCLRSQPMRGCHPNRGQVLLPSGDPLKSPPSDTPKLMFEVAQCVALKGTKCCSQGRWLVCLLIYACVRGGESILTHGLRSTRSVLGTEFRSSG